MSIIGRNKLLTYIQSNPKAATTITVWYRGIYKREGKRLLKESTSRLIFGSSGIGTGEYSVE